MSPSPYSTLAIDIDRRAGKPVNRARRPMPRTCFPKSDLDFTAYTPVPSADGERHSGESWGIASVFSSRGVSAIVTRSWRRGENGSARDMGYGDTYSWRIARNVQDVYTLTRSPPGFADVFCFVTATRLRPVTEETVGFIRNCR